LVTPQQKKIAQNYASRGLNHTSEKKLHQQTINVAPYITRITNIFTYKFGSTNQSKDSFIKQSKYNKRRKKRNRSSFMHQVTRKQGKRK